MDRSAGLTQYHNNPEAAIKEIKEALAQPTAGKMKTETVSMAKKILNSDKSTPEMIAAAKQLKDKLEKISSEGRLHWFRS